MVSIRAQFFCYRASFFKSMKTMKILFLAWNWAYFVIQCYTQKFVPMMMSSINRCKLKRDLSVLKWIRMHLLVSYCILGIFRVPYLNTNWSMSGWGSISKEKKTVTKTQCSILSTHAIPYDLLSQSKYVILMGSFIYTHLPNIYMVRISVSVWFVMIMTSHNAHSYALFYIIGWHSRHK